MDKKQTALEILGRLGEVPQGDIRPSMELVGDLGIDSPKALALLVELEDALGVEIEDSDAAAMDTVKDVLGYVGERT